MRSINRKSFDKNVGWVNLLLPDPAFATPKKKLVQSDRCICFYDSLFYLVLIVSLERFISRGLISKTVV